jgi:integrase
LEPLEKKGLISTVHKVKAFLSIIFKYALSKEYVVSNPAELIGNSLLTRATVHRNAIVNPSEVGELIAKIKAYDGRKIDYYALNLLPYLFVRPGELRAAEWREIDLETATWKIPAEKKKMRSPHMVPLSSQVVGLLTELKELTGGGKHVFANAKGKVPTHKNIGIALGRIGYDSSKMMPHGFRAMASTLLNELNYNPDWIERQLAHSERKGVRAAYNHAEHLPERRKMMQEYSDYLDGLAAKYGKVTLPASL